MPEYCDVKSLSITTPEPPFPPEYKSAAAPPPPPVLFVPFSPESDT